MEMTGSPSASYATSTSAAATRASSAVLATAMPIDCPQWRTRSVAKHSSSCAIGPMVLSPPAGRSDAKSTATTPGAARAAAASTEPMRAGACVA